MKTQIIACVFAIGCATLSANDRDINTAFALQNLQNQLAQMQAQRPKTPTAYVPGESAEQREARHAQAIADADAAYKKEWDAKNPFKPSASRPPLDAYKKGTITRESDLRAAADASVKAEPAKPDPEVVALKEKIAALQKQVAAQKKAAAKAKK